MIENKKLGKKKLVVKNKNPPFLCKYVISIIWEKYNFYIFFCVKKKKTKSVSFVVLYIINNCLMNCMIITDFINCLLVVKSSLKCRKITTFNW